VAILGFWCGPDAIRGANQLGNTFSAFVTTPEREMASLLALPVMGALEML